MNHLIPIFNFQDFHLVEQLHYLHLFVQGLIKIPIGLFDRHQEFSLDAIQFLFVPWNQLLMIRVELSLRCKYFDCFVAILHNFHGRLDDSDEYFENLIVEIALSPFRNDNLSEVFSKPHKDITITIEQIQQGGNSK